MRLLSSLYAKMTKVIEGIAESQLMTCLSILNLNPRVSKRPFLSILNL